jgi:hypothetical protein
MPAQPAHALAKENTMLVRSDNAASRTSGSELIPTRPAAEVIITTLTLPAGPHAAQRQALSPGWMTSGPAMPVILHGVGRVDRCGKISNRQIVETPRWWPGDRLETVLTANAAIVRPAPGGTLRVHTKPCIPLSVSTRRVLRLETADHVVLAASPEYRAVIVHNTRQVDELLIALAASLSIFPEAEETR